MQSIVEKNKYYLLRDRLDLVCLKMSEVIFNLAKRIFKEESIERK